MLKTSIIVLLIFICSIISVENSHAVTRFTMERIFDREINDVFKYRLNDDICFPAELAAKNEIYVFIFAGGAYQTIKVFSITGASELAYMLEKAFSSGYLKNAVIDYHEQKYSSVVVRYSTAKMGKLESSTTVKVEDIRRWLVFAGFKPHIVVRVYNFAELSTDVEPTYEWAGEKWFNPEESKIGDNLTVRVKSSRVSMNVFYLIFIILPAMSAIGTVAASVWAVKSSAPVEYRWNVVTTIPFKLPLSVIMLQLPLFVFLAIFTDWFRKIGDLWYGSVSMNPIGPLIIYSLFVVLLSIPISFLAQKKIMDMEPSGLEPLLVTEENARKATITKSLLLVQAVAVMTFIIALFCYNYIIGVPALLFVMVVKYIVKNKPFDR